VLSFLRSVFCLLPFSKKRIGRMNIEWAIIVRISRGRESEEYRAEDNWKNIECNKIKYLVKSRKLILRMCEMMT
jgi:hypothetical protein